jgi:hypothetical protein
MLIIIHDLFLYVNDSDIRLAGLAVPVAVLA